MHFCKTVLLLLSNSSHFRSTDLIGRFTVCVLFTLWVTTVTVMTPSPLSADVVDDSFFTDRVGFTIWRLARRRCKGRRDAGFLMRYCAIIIWTFPSYLYRSGSDGFIATVLKTKHPKLDRNVILPESGALLVSGWKLL